MLYRINVNLDHDDLLNLIKSVKPKTMQECDDLTKVGWMKFTGNQHNENWEWCLDKLKDLSVDDLWTLYISMK